MFRRALGIASRVRNTATRPASLAHLLKNCNIASDKIRFPLAAVLHDKTGMRQADQLIEPAVFFVQGAQHMKVLAFTQADRHISACTECELPFHALNDERGHPFLKERIVVVIEVLPLIHKTQGTNRGHIKGFREGFDSPESSHHFVHKCGT